VPGVNLDVEAHASETESCAWIYRFGNLSGRAGRWLDAVPALDQLPALVQ
jgi:hypothetical protein